MLQVTTRRVAQQVTRLAQPDSRDPVERQSTRIQAIGTMGGQGTYDPVKIKQLIGGRATSTPRC